jgi:CheY-like chemotaxis protein
MIDQTRSFDILLAEDSSADITLVREALKQHSIQCSLHVIRDGAQVVALLDDFDKDPRAPALDLLLLDMHLPKCDGQEILRRLRSTTHYAQTPVVVMASVDSAGLEEPALKCAALKYFPKPSTLDEFMELGAVVRHLLMGEAGSSSANGSAA